MAGFPNYSSTPIQNLVGQVGSTATAQNPDNTVANLMLGRQGDALVSEVHGKYYAQVSRGRVFSAVKSAGSLLLAPAGTTGGLTLYNPVGSGVNLELIEVSVVPTTATGVVAGISLEYGAPPTSGGTAVTAANMLIAGTNSFVAQGLVKTGATIVAMTLLMNLPVFIQTTANILQGSALTYRFDGAVVIGPGGAVNVVATVTQSTNVVGVGYIWAEHLI
jgi:hypothetical protein